MFGMDQFDLLAVLNFSLDLKWNNNRNWFLEHRSAYEIARGHFEDFVSALISELSLTEPLADLSPKDCIFRLNRDLRFTKDKTPYKPYMSAYIAPGGKKSRRLGYYVHLEPGNSMLAGGMYDPDPQQLNAWREAIDHNPRPFKQIAASEQFVKYFGQVSGDRLKTIPRGYPKDHPDADLLQFKSITVVRKVTDTQVTAKNFIKDSMDTFKAMKPFLEYLESLG
jgi:uncharacterized protein (TIGR02453 family)